MVDQAERTLRTDHLAAALQGNADEFSELTEPYRRELRVHCYRMLGSLTEAEDMVQETFLRAWKRLATYHGRSTFRTWLYKIATNACIDWLDRVRSRRYLPADISPATDPEMDFVPPTPDVRWLEPYPDKWLIDQAAANPEAHYSTTENISLAFLTALQSLPPRQRAELILCDVLEWSAQETADLLGLTVSSVSSALHRARIALAKNYRGRKTKSTSFQKTYELKRRLLNGYVHAWQAADVDKLMALLKQDAAFSMPPSPAWYLGRAAIRKFMMATVFANEGMFPGKAKGRWKLYPVQANRQPAVAIYVRGETDEYRTAGIHVLMIEGSHLSQIIGFMDPTLPVHFGLPEVIEG
jgi:RNA polymerase sigma-70 factor (ECF subfamily)